MNKNRLEHIFESLIWGSRKIVIFAVVANIISAVLLTIYASYEVFLVIKDSFYAFGDKAVFDVFKKNALTKIISSVDYYLIATVLLIFGIGLYELFISKIDVIKENEGEHILIIKSLEDLKEKFAKMIMLVLTVTFFNFALRLNYEDIYSLLMLALGILIISGASFLAFLSSKKEKKQ